MIKNSINIEGLAGEADLGEVSFKSCRTYDYNVKLSVNTGCGIKDIYQVSLNTTLDSKRIIKLKDSQILLLAGTTNYKILSVENTSDNNINYLEEKSFFNTSITSPASQEENVEVYIIDALFNLINNYEIYCSLTYLFVFDKRPEDENEAKDNEKKLKYNLINLSKEFC